MLTNNVVSFEQPSPDLQADFKCAECINIIVLWATLSVKASVHFSGPKSFEQLLEVQLRAEEEKVRFSDFVFMLKRDYTKLDDIIIQLLHNSEHFLSQEHESRI